MAENKLGPKEFFGPENLGPGSNPDGLTIDAEGNVWIALIVPYLYCFRSPVPGVKPY